MREFTFFRRFFFVELHVGLKRPDSYVNIFQIEFTLCKLRNIRDGTLAVLKDPVINSFF